MKWILWKTRIVIDNETFNKNETEHFGGCMNLEIINEMIGEVICVEYIVCVWFKTWTIKKKDRKFS